MKILDTAAAPAIATVDLILFALGETGLEVLLIRRGAAPFLDAWALPGGWIHTDEDADLDAAAHRILREKTGVATPYIEQLQTVGNATRDPRGWSLSVAYVALIGPGQAPAVRGGNAADAAWRPVEAVLAEAGDLAFDHGALLGHALARVRRKVEYSTLPVHLLPERFTLSDLQSVYERVLGRRLDKSAFRKRMAEVDFVEPVPGEMRRGSNRPAQIYRLKEARSTAFFDRVL
ncbi:NUDIX hydrolase [Nitrospirillum sp. BR 11828]|uniref:NUDIX hydrolase n=1 Tax=Nitrospirillum sp. BR 11828 TaxID=3104325 RepID=UPI002ACA48C2|nr:NUDIX domain-containing protein [Nitrospirillum sp. BR 11828]MDZ5647645.1 NUDIX domain-containing protein [Nitrospirillum sp. BR 11828]